MTGSTEYPLFVKTAKPIEAICTRLTSEVSISKQIQSKAINFLLINYTYSREREINYNFENVYSTSFARLDRTSLLKVCLTSSTN